MFRTSACPVTAATRGSTNGRTISRRASGATDESESTKQMISASVARMPAAIAARLPRLCEKRMACRFGKRREANAMRCHVSSVEPSSTAKTEIRSCG